MIEVKANLWEYPADYRCVTTNGVVMKNGELVMGAGNALEAKLRYPDLPQILGNAVKLLGNIPHIVPKYKIISFPTKHHWKDKSDIELIRYSAELIHDTVRCCTIKSIIIPRPGCGLGGLNWKDVKPVLKQYFTDERFIICSM